MDVLSAVSATVVIYCLGGLGFFCGSVMTVIGARMTVKQKARSSSRAEDNKQAELVLDGLRTTVQEQAIFYKDQIKSLKAENDELEKENVVLKKVVEAIKGAPHA